MAAVTLARNLRDVSTTFDKLEDAKKQLKRYEARKEGNDENPTVKLSKYLLDGCCGARVDAVEHYTSLKTELTQQVKTLRDESEKKFTRVGFVTFKTIPQAVLASQALLHEYPQFNVTENASYPGDVNWRALPIPYWRRAVSYVLVRIGLFFLLFFWVFPVAFISGAYQPTV